MAITCRAGVRPNRKSALVERSGDPVLTRRTERLAAAQAARAGSLTLVTRFCSSPWPSSFYCSQVFPFSPSPWACICSVRRRRNSYCASHACLSPPWPALTSSPGPSSGRFLLTCGNNRSPGLCIGTSARFSVAGLSLLAGGVLLSVVVQFLSNFLPIPKTLPIDDFFRTPADVWMVALFGTFVAPVFEELAFRGFLLPSMASAWDWLRGQQRGLLDGARMDEDPRWSIPALVISCTAYQHRICVGTRRSAGARLGSVGGPVWRKPGALRGAPVDPVPGRQHVHSRHL